MGRQRDSNGRFVKGHKGAKPVGAVDRKKRAAKRLVELGCDPIEALVRVARAAEENNELTVAASCYKELCSYCYPKLQAIKHSSDDGTDTVQTIRIISELPDGIGPGSA